MGDVRKLLLLLLLCLFVLVCGLHLAGAHHAQGADGLPLVLAAITIIFLSKLVRAKSSTPSRSQVVMLHSEAASTGAGQPAHLWITAGCWSRGVALFSVGAMDSMN
jgi:hypothetical protein